MLWVGDASHGKHEKKYSLLVVRTLETWTSQWLWCYIYEQNTTELSVWNVCEQNVHLTGLIGQFITGAEDYDVSITLI